MSPPQRTMYFSTTPYKNKWQSQKIQKKHNEIQKASKHYGKSDNNLISKKKYPVKQRKDIKKFKIQRRRKKIYKQMAFDFDDFILQNRNENFKRIQIRPTIQYHTDIDNIRSIYNDYYHPIAQNKSIRRNKNEKQTLANGIIVNIKYYKIDTSTSSHICSENVLNSATTTIKGYGNKNNFRTQKTNQSLPISQKIVFSNHLLNNDEIKSTKIITKDLLRRKIANNALKLYKNMITIKHQLNINNMTQKWNITYPDNIGNDFINLNNIFYECIPEMFFIYDILCNFLGYKSLYVILAKANLNLLSKSTQLSSNANNGISYYSRSLYKRHRKYSDYVKDIKSFIPTYIYYKENQNGDYIDIGEYNKYDWNLISYFTNSKKRKQRQRKKRKRERLANKECTRYGWWNFHRRMTAIPVVKRGFGQRRTVRDCGHGCCFDVRESVNLWKVIYLQKKYGKFTRRVPNKSW